MKTRAIGVAKYARSSVFANGDLPEDLVESAFYRIDLDNVKTFLAHQRADGDGDRLSILADDPERSAPVGPTQDVYAADLVQGLNRRLSEIEVGRFKLDADGVMNR